jgi:hypothetical protein
MSIEINGLGAVLAGSALLSDFVINLGRLVFYLVHWIRSFWL